MTNLTNLKNSTLNLLNECTLYTKSITLTLLVFHSLSYIPHASQYLSIIPAFIIPPKFWIISLLTFSFYETNILFVIIDITLIFFTEKLLLPLWGAWDLIKFCALVNCLSAISMVTVYIFLYAATYNELYLFRVEIHGMAALLAALAVSWRQLMGDGVVVAMKLTGWKYRNKHVAMTILVVFVLFYMVFDTVVELSVLIMYFNGLLISWVYLRFYQRHNNGIVGDLSEKFAFAGFFPYYLESPISVITNSIFAGLIYLRICNKIDRRYDISSPTTISISVSSGDGGDSERRKQLALKALNDRLSLPDKSSNWPSLDDDKDDKTKSSPNDNKERLLTKVFSDNKYNKATEPSVLTSSPSVTTVVAADYNVQS